MLLSNDHEWVSLWPDGITRLSCLSIIEWRMCESEEYHQKFEQNSPENIYFPQNKMVYFIFFIKVTVALVPCVTVFFSVIKGEFITYVRRRWMFTWIPGQFLFVFFVRKGRWTGELENRNHSSAGLGLIGMPFPVWWYVGTCMIHTLQTHNEWRQIRSLTAPLITNTANSFFEGKGV